MSVDLEKIEGRIDRAVASGTEVSMSLGGVQIKDLGQLFEISKMMSIAGVAVPYHLRGNPGACLAVAMRALRNGFDPFELAEHSYTMKKSQKGPDGRWEEVETIAFDSFVIRAIIDAHAGMTGPIRYAYEGEGDDMVCIATCRPPGEKEAIVHKSPTLGALKAARGRNDKGSIKGSPLWETKPQQQMAYDTGRDLCRRYFPAVLLGWHDRDEMDENVPPERVIDPPKTSGLRDRLRAPKESQRGFDAAQIAKTIDGEVAKSATKPKETTVAATPSAPVQAAAETEPGSPAEGSGLAAADQSPEGGTAPDATQARSEPSATEASHSASVADPSEEIVGPGPDEGAPATDAPEPAEASDDGSSAGVSSEPSFEPWKAPPIPNNEREYVQYVRDILADPELVNADDARDWWNSKEQKKLRNSFPNMTSEIIDECKTIVGAKIKQLKGE